MADILAIFRAGFVRRWHTHPDLAHTCDRIDGHSARVARIILALHPGPSRDLIKAALIHDDGESVVGDMPYGGKAGRLGAEYCHAETMAQEALWNGRDCRPPEEEIAWLQFADRLDAYMWAAHHAPHIMNGDGWPEARAWLIGQSHGLGCGGDIEGLLSWVTRHAA